jgi:hypothetical protein
MKLGIPSWKMRRRAVFGSLIFGMAIISYITIRGVDSGLNETLALGGFGLIGAVVAAYIGGAAYEDVRLRQVERSGRSRTHNEYSEDDDYLGEEDVH